MYSEREGSQDKKIVIVMVPPLGTTFKWTWPIFLFSSYLIISDFEL